MRTEARQELHIVREDSAPQPGDIVAGRYELKGMIGRGGVGEIYLASQVDAPEGTPDVVVKMLADRWLDDTDSVARFEREASRLRSIDHPNIVAMHDNGVDRGRPFLVMEYIEGESLADYLNKKRRLSLKEFVPIAAQVLKGMGHAHLREMMIRDVKPSNIMLCNRKGRANFVKILDFGLAKFTRDEPPLTGVYVVGTAGYLAPEAIRGEELDLRVDVYAIGVLFYHLLSGLLPFTAEQGATILYKTINEPAPNLEDVLPPGHGVPSGLIELIHDCLEKDPQRRPADANIVVERLIDAVPASHFRLPSSPRLGPAPLGGQRLITRPHPGFGNTGMIELLRSRRTRPDASDEHPKRKRAFELMAVVALACVASVATAWIVSSPGAPEHPQTPDLRPAAAAIPGATERASAPTAGTAQAQAAPDVRPKGDNGAAAPVGGQDLSPTASITTGLVGAAAPAGAALPQSGQPTGRAQETAVESAASTPAKLRRRRVRRKPPKTEPLAPTLPAPPSSSPLEAVAPSPPETVKPQPVRRPATKRKSVFLSADRPSDGPAERGSLISAD